MDNKKIAIFDSGVGGLTVLKEVKKILPNEDIIYFGDTKRVPYGPRSKNEIIKFSLEIVSFLLKKDIKIIVVACNTITSVSMEEIKNLINIPLIGVIEPGIKMALDISKNNRIGLIATERTIKSGVYQNRIEDELKSSKIMGVSTPELVQIVEKGIEEIGEKESLKKIGNYFREFENFEMDTLILGCTHFPVIENQIKLFTGNIKIVNPALETAIEVKRILQGKDILKKQEKLGEIQYYISADREKFKAIGEKIVGEKMNNIYKVKL